MQHLPTHKLTAHHHYPDIIRSVALPSIPSYTVCTFLPKTTISTPKTIIISIQSYIKYESPMNQQNMYLPCMQRAWL
jgi:hypothetical protein